MKNISLHTLQMTILKILSKSSNQKQHKHNLIGKGKGKGIIEQYLNVEFDTSGKLLADRAFEQLIEQELIRPTYTDVIDPEKWVEITKAGIWALQNNAIDELDRALKKIDSNLIEMRAGAWAAIYSQRPDAIRQAAHSARELIDQVLKLGAPDSDVEKDKNFIPDSSSKSGITRRHRLKYLMTTYRGNLSDTELLIAEKAYELVIAVDNKLIAISHSRGKISGNDVKDSIKTAEIVLRKLLVTNKND